LTRQPLLNRKHRLDPCCSATATMQTRRVLSMDHCPAGHELTLWTARAGQCDGCKRFVLQGEQIMDCRACNYYLCRDCRPCISEQVDTVWGAFSNLLFGDVCRAPPAPSQLQTEEFVIREAEGDVEVGQPITYAQAISRRRREPAAFEASELPAPTETPATPIVRCARPDQPVEQAKNRPNSDEQVDFLGLDVDDRAAEGLLAAITTVHAIDLLGDLDAPIAAKDLNKKASRTSPIEGVVAEAAATVGGA